MILIKNNDCNLIWLIFFFCKNKNWEQKHKIKYHRPQNENRPVDWNGKKVIILFLDQIKIIFRKRKINTNKLIDKLWIISYFQRNFFFSKKCTIVSTVSVRPSVFEKTHYRRIRLIFSLKVIAWFFRIYAEKSVTFLNCDFF